jgi:uncharacterized protein (DUF2141 family)
MMRKIAIILLFILNLTVEPGHTAAFQGSNTDTGSIVVTVVNIRSDEGGNLIVSLYAAGETWLDIEKAFITEILSVDSDSMTVRFTDVPYDSAYAVAVVHDKNRNGKMDMRKFPWPKPKEGAGVSNNDFGFGPPDYDDALIKLDSPILNIRIELRY